MNRLLKELLYSQPEFKVSISITGTLLSRQKAFAPDVLEDFKALVATGRVEIVAETYYHSLAFFTHAKNLKRQVTMHREMVERVFAVLRQPLFVIPSFILRRYRRMGG